MIIDHLKNAEHYKGLHPNIDQALDAARHTDLNALDLGRHNLSDGLDVIIDQYHPQDDDSQAYEAHQKNIDIQVMLSGDEYMAVAPLTEQQPVQAYNPEDDFALYDVKGQRFHLKTGMFVIFFPTDLHLPALGHSDKPVRKAVFKAKINSEDHQ